MSRKTYMLIIIGVILSCTRSFTQCIEKNRAFSVGEEMHFYAYYNWGLIWMKIGEASFSVGEEDGNYVFTVKAKNLKGWDWLYHLRTTQIASMTKDFRPLYLKANTVENKVWSKSEYIYNGDKIYKYSENIDCPEGKDTSYAYTPCSWDVINAVYVARNIELEKVKAGEKIPFYANFSEQTHTIYGEVLKKEKIKNKAGKEFDCLKCSATVAAGTIFAEGKPVYVWITDDERQVPVLVESQITIGAIKVFLYDYKSGKE